MTQGKEDKGPNTFTEDKESGCCLADPSPASPPPLLPSSPLNQPPPRFPAPFSSSSTPPPTYRSSSTLITTPAEYRRELITGAFTAMLRTLVLAGVCVRVCVKGGGVL